MAHPDRPAPAMAPTSAGGAAALDALVDRDADLPFDGAGGGDVCVTVAAVADLPTLAGLFRIVTFHDERDGVPHVAMVRGDVVGFKDVATRIHADCFAGDVMGSLRCSCRADLERALELVGGLERGVLLYLRQEGLCAARGVRDVGRDYAVAAHILRSLEVTSVRLITDHADDVEQLARCGVSVTNRIPA